MDNRSKRDDRVIAVIPARGGSKSISRKNLRDVCGHPLFYYQIRNALKAGTIDRTILATDDSEIASLAAKIFGDDITIVERPPEISHDLSRTEETLMYVLSKLYANDNVEIVVTLEPTNPLNRPEYVEDCIRLLKDGGYDSSCCVVEDYSFFTDTPKDIERLIKRPMRQEMTPMIRETGNCWATKVSVLRGDKNRIGGKIGFVKIPLRDSYHIDNEDDWRIVEALLRFRENKDGGYFAKRAPKSAGEDYDMGYWSGVTDPDGKVRDKTTERAKRLEDCKEEIGYINDLQPGRVLDVGCGLGFLLSGLKKEWDKYGVEISSFAAEKARQHGKIFNGPLEKASYAADYFDAVVLSHVIEHVEDPVVMLDEVRRILKPYGKLIVTTPDFDCGLARRFKDNFRLLYDKGHVSLFSAFGLYRLLKDMMFEIENVSYPFFDTEHFTIKNLERLFDTDKVSPPFYGNVVTVYAYKK